MGHVRADLDERGIQRLSESKSTYGQIEELIDLVKSYIKQETVDPLRTLGKRFGLGVGAAVVFGMSAIFFSLGFLRIVDRYLGFMSRGVLSAVPYILAVAILGTTLYLIWTRQARSSGGEIGE